MLADYHVHTEFSADSEYPIEEVVRDGIEKGLDEICFTDHVDYGVQDDWEDGVEIRYRTGGPNDPPLMPLMNVDYPRYYEAIRYLQKKYSEKIELKFGLEFGVQMSTVQKYEKLFSEYPFDFIILSIHQIDDKEFWNQAFQTGKTQREYNLAYYREMLNVVRSYKNYSVLGHLDMITRYDKAGIFPFEETESLVTEILKQIIEDEKGIEINTSYHRYGLPDSTPSRKILEKYRDLGGKIVTIGTDSHRKEHLGAYISEAKKELKKIGFDSFCTFEKMQPVYHRL